MMDISLQIEQRHKILFAKALSQLARARSDHDVSCVVEQADDEQREEEQNVVLCLLEELILLPVK